MAKFRPMTVTETESQVGMFNMFIYVKAGASKVKAVKAVPVTLAIETYTPRPPIAPTGWAQYSAVPLDHDTVEHTEEPIRTVLVSTCEPKLIPETVVGLAPDVAPLGLAKKDATGESNVKMDKAVPPR